MYRRYHDPQDALPTGWCEDCGKEIYENKRLCGSCQEQEEYRMAMKELAAEYRQSAELLGNRIDELEEQKKKAEGAVLDRLNHRTSELCKLYRETMRTARELEHYDS